MELTDAAIELGVRNLVGRYCEATAIADADAFLSCWARGAEWLVEDLEGGVTSRTAEGFAERRAKYSFLVQQLLSGVVTVAKGERTDGIVAEAAWIIEELTCVAGQAPKTTIGRYADRITIEDGEYRFASRKLKVIYAGPPDLSGVSRSAVANGNDDVSAAAVLPPLPMPDELSRPFWNGLAAGELRLQRCVQCAVWIHPPEPFCPQCGATEFGYESASLTGVVHSYVVMRDRRVLGYADRVPYVNVWAEMDVAPDLLLLANLVDTDADEIEIGKRVTVEFERISDDLTLPVFRLDRGTV